VYSDEELDCKPYLPDMVLLELMDAIWINEIYLTNSDMLKKMLLKKSQLAFELFSKEGLKSLRP